MTTKFETNKKYSYSYACNSSSYVGLTVIKRTAKRITFQDQFGDITTRGILVWNDVEVFRPEGNYSMAPVVTADREVK